MKPRVAVALPLFPDQLERLRAVAEVIAPEGAAPMSPVQLHAALAQADAALISIFQPFGEAELAYASQLRTLANIGVGVNHIDLAACARAGVTVTNTPGVVDEPTADHAFALLLAAARKVAEGHVFVQSRQWQTPAAPLMGLDVHHRTLGIVGFGGIGQQLARRASGFEMTVLYHQRHRVAPDIETRLNARHVPLDELLHQADFVVMQVPYSAETHHLIGATELARMKRSAILINTARGGVVDDAALADALKAGTIAGAALDVFENEPAVLPALLGAPNLTLSPHMGSATLATRHAMVARAVDNLLAGLEGAEPVDRVLAR